MPAVTSMYRLELASVAALIEYFWMVGLELASVAALNEFFNRCCGRWQCQLFSTAAVRSSGWKLSRIISCRCAGTAHPLRRHMSARQLSRSESTARKSGSTAKATARVNPTATGAREGWPNWTIGDRADRRVNRSRNCKHTMNLSSFNIISQTLPDIVWTKCERDLSVVLMDPGCANEGNYPTRLP